MGDRLARQAILSGLEFDAGTPHGELLCDETVEAANSTRRSRGRVETLHELRPRQRRGQPPRAARRREPLDLFRQYMATFCREQAVLSLSPALMRNLEEHWNAHERRL